MTLCFGVAPRPASSINVGAVPPPLFLSPRSRQHYHDPPPAAWTLPPRVRPHLDVVSDIDPTRLPGPAYHSIHALWTPLLLHSSPSFTNTVSTRAAEARDDAPAVGYRTTEHPPETYWWHVRAIKYKGTEIVASTPLPSYFNTFSSSGFLCVCVCVYVCVLAPVHLSKTTEDRYCYHYYCYYFRVKSALCHFCKLPINKSFLEMVPARFYGFFH